MNEVERDEYLDHFRARLIQDAMAEATARYWFARARVFEAARPRPGDYNGQATPDELAATDARLAASAQACRDRAIVSQ